MKFLFVVGCGRSGTTFLTKELGRITDEKIYSIPYETAFFIDTYENGNLENTKKLDNTIRKMLYREYIVNNYPAIHEKVKKQFSTFSEKTYANLLRALGIVLSQEDKLPIPDIIVEKTPTHLLHTHKIFQEFPDTKLIILERNPLSVIASAIRYGINRLKLLPIPQSHKILAQYWEWLRNREKSKSLLKQIPPHQVLFVRYEELVKHPNRVLQDINQLLGANYKGTFKVKDNTLEKFTTFFSDQELSMLSKFIPPDIATIYNIQQNDKGIWDRVLFFWISILCNTEIFLVNNLPFYIKMKLKKWRGDVDVPPKSILKNA